jgi:hypothetical protein
MAEGRAHQYMLEKLGGPQSWSAYSDQQVFWFKFEKGITNKFKRMVIRRK